MPGATSPIGAARRAVWEIVRGDEPAAALDEGAEVEQEPRRLGRRQRRAHLGPHRVAARLERGVERAARRRVEPEPRGAGHHLAHQHVGVAQLAHHPPELAAPSSASGAIAALPSARAEDREGGPQPAQPDAELVRPLDDRAVGDHRHVGGDLPQAVAEHVAGRRLDRRLGLEARRAGAARPRRRRRPRPSAPAGSRAPPCSSGAKRTGRSGRAAAPARRPRRPRPRRARARPRGSARAPRRRTISPSSSASSTSPPPGAASRSTIRRTRVSKTGASGASPAASRTAASAPSGSGPPAPAARRAPGTRSRGARRARSPPCRRRRRLTVCTQRRPIRRSRSATPAAASAWSGGVVVDRDQRLASRARRERSPASAGMPPQPRELARVQPDLQLGLGHRASPQSLWFGDRFHATVTTGQLTSGLMAARTIASPDCPSLAAAAIRFLRRHRHTASAGGGTLSDQEWLRTGVYCRKVDVPT